jgi:O-acetyl-ADP-ribose deacetylase (regulator of RNase III)
VSRVRPVHVVTVLGDLEGAGTDLIIRAGTRRRERGRTVTISAPRWHPPSGPEHRLAETYRDALAVANARGARSLALPAILARGPWPLEDVTRIALCVLHGTPTTVQDVIIVARTPAMLERWAEALIREAH